MGAWLVVLACGAEPRPEVPAEEVPAAPDAGQGSGRAVTPWGIAREREREARELTEQAKHKVEAARAEQARIEAMRAARAEQARRAAAGSSASGTTGAAVTPMSRAEPVPAPMSRPEPEAKRLAAPPLVYTLRTEAPLSHQGPRPRLEKRSAKRNAIIDEDAWFLAHGLSLPMWDVPRATPFGGPWPGSLADPLPPEVATTFAGGSLGTAIRGVDHSIAIYSSSMGARGQAVVVRDAIGDSLGAFDLSGWPPGQELQWAQLEGGVLFLCTYHPTYASSTGGKNAYLTAIAVGSGELLWQSDPLVCNTRNFLLRDGWIISGYGFTDEPDFLFVLDAKTGAVVQELKLASGPEVILEKSGTLLVRTYDRDYQFAIR